MLGLHPRVLDDLGNNNIYQVLSDWNMTGKKRVCCAMYTFFVFDVLYLCMSFSLCMNCLCLLGVRVKVDKTLARTVLYKSALLLSSSNVVN